MKVTLEYNPSNGVITDKTGAIVGNWTGLESFSSETKISKSNLIRLKEAGFNTDEIIELAKNDLL